MPPKPQRGRVRLKRWPTPDWGHAHWAYRGLKASVEGFLKRAIPIRWRGLEHVPRVGGALLVPNHLSYSDPVVLGAVVERPLFYLAMEKLFERRFWRWLATATSQIPVDRRRGGNEAAIRAAVDYLDAGFLVGIFPEGGRALEGETKRWRTGAARVAMLSGVPVLPVAMTTDVFLPKGSARPRFGAKVYINIGRPLRFERDDRLAMDAERARAVTDEIRGRVAALLEEAYAARDRDEKWP